MEISVAFYTKTFNIHEQWYCITEMLVAVVYVTQKFNEYLWGQSVKLWTAAVSFMLHL